MGDFRYLTANDIPEAVAMMEQFYAIDHYPLDKERSTALFERFIADEKLGRAWVIYHENEIAGYMIMTFIFSFEYGGRIAFIDELFVKDSFRGHGIGKAAVTYAMQQATKLGLKLLYLEVEQHNSRAQQLYFDAGFSMHNRLLMRHKFE
ncbi:GNAT family N-acetyltransferase [Flavobacterium sp.]|uniref:GNAT family N-acetyltransferase n=1 Tax=Flavobacterium sp. TaxID=239 RepID=UPI0026307194|nr:GNAT family N-acetyltransferase [Flavobacterium sp.]